MRRLANEGMTMMVVTHEIGFAKKVRGTVEEIGEAVIWLLSDKSSYLTGHDLVLDGGFSISLGVNEPI